MRHLPSDGWQASVLTVEEDTFSEKDASLMARVDPAIHVHKARALEPFDLYRSFLGKKRGDKLVASETISLEDRGVRHRIAIWIRMNLFVPDARIGWYWSAVKKGREVFAREHFDGVVSIGPPHTCLLVGKRIAQTFGIPHVPVFIDPWVDISYYRGFKRSAPTLWLDRRLERSVLDQAAHIVFVTNGMREDYLRRNPNIEKKSSVLYWGYDEEEFADFKPSRVGTQEVLLHAGNIFEHQNPKALWPTLRKQIEGGRDLKLEFVGTVAPGIRASIREAGLEERTVLRGFLPYREMINELGKASYLLVCASEKRHVPGKLFEYLRTGKSILAFGDDNSEVEGILRSTGAGMMFPYSSSANVFFEKLSELHPNGDSALPYDRRSIASRFANILTEISA